MDEKVRTFTVTVKIKKDTPGALEDDVNFSRLIKMIKDGIEESCGRTLGIINSYMIGEVLIKASDEENEYGEISNARIT